MRQKVKRPAAAGRRTQDTSVHIEDCEGCWLSSCRSSVAEHWRLKPEVSWVWVLAAAGLFTSFYFCLIKSKFPALGKILWAFRNVLVIPYSQKNLAVWSQTEHKNTGGILIWQWRLTAQYVIINIACTFIWEYCQSFHLRYFTVSSQIYKKYNCQRASGKLAICTARV